MSEEANSPNEPRLDISLTEEDNSAHPMLTNNLRQFGHRVLGAKD